MGLMSFIKEAGEKLFGKGDAKAAEEAAAIGADARDHRSAQRGGWQGDRRLHRHAGR